MTDTIVEMLLGMFFLSLSNTNMLLLEWKLIWNSYTTAEAILTTKQIKLIKKREFAKAALDANSKTFMVHVSALQAPLARMSINPSQKA